MSPFAQFNSVGLDYEDTFNGITAIPYFTNMGEEVHKHQIKGCQFLLNFNSAELKEMKAINLLD